MAEEDERFKAPLPNRPGFDEAWLEAVISFRKLERLLVMVGSSTYNPEGIKNWDWPLDHETLAVCKSYWEKLYSCLSSLFRIKGLGVSDEMVSQILAVLEKRGWDKGRCHPPPNELL